jgi:hypothetical protein
MKGQNKDKWLRVRLTAEEEKTLELWAAPYEGNKSFFIRKLLHLLSLLPVQSIGYLEKIFKS